MHSSDNDTESGGEPVTAAGVPKARLAARISADYVLRTLRLVTEAHGGDLLRAVIFQAISAANVAHLDRSRGESASDETPPDEARRPVSVLSIANGLGLPFETVRRHANRMIADGLCLRVSRGVIVPTSVLNSERSTAAGEANLQNLARLVRDLRRAGIEL